MIRCLIVVGQIVVVLALALWLSDAPGSAHIVWHDRVIDTSAAFLAVGVIILAYALHLLFRLSDFLRHGPALWRLRRKLDKTQQGQRQLTQGLIAIAAGHAGEAGRLAVAARNHLGVSVAAQWLQAQAAQLAGDDRAARDIFRALAADKDAAVLGYRGLITAAKKAGQWDDVDRLMTELHHLKPATPWLSLIRMESAARQRQWGAAEQALSHAVAARLLEDAPGRQARAALRLAVSRETLSGGDRTAALQAAEQAAKMAPDWLPALLNLVETLYAAGHARAAQRALERIWKTHPHPHLSEILRRAAPTPLAAYKLTRHVCRGREDSFDSRLALAEAALAADLWGEARHYLLAIVNDRAATRHVYMLLARLERRERGDDRAASGWLAKAADAAADAAWHCAACGDSPDAWQPVCSRCDSFNSVSWQGGGGPLSMPAPGGTSAHGAAQSSAKAKLFFD